MGEIEHDRNICSVFMNISLDSYMSLIQDVIDLGQIIKKMGPGKWTEYLVYEKILNLPPPPFADPHNHIK